MIIDHMPWWTERNKKFADECDHFCDEYLVPLAYKLLDSGQDPMEIQWTASKLCIDKGVIKETYSKSIENLSEITEFVTVVIK